LTELGVQQTNSHPTHNTPLTIPYMELKHAGSIVTDSSMLYTLHYDHCITLILLLYVLAIITKISAKE